MNKKLLVWPSLQPARAGTRTCSVMIILSYLVICVVAKPYKRLFFHRNAIKVYDIFVHVNIYLGLGNSHLHFLK